MCVSAYVTAELLAGGSEADAVGVFSALTGWLNRRGFTERFEAERSDHARYDGRPLGLIVIDLDDFKAVNDTQGHAAGDALLCRVAAALAADLRPSDVLGRLGGDEFAVLLPETGPGELLAAAERLEQHLGLVIAASLGLASLPADGETAEALHRSADADLYRSKQRRAVAAIA
jgi:diguanylate cyclase (GGDEF)-like protein